MQSLVCKRSICNNYYSYLNEKICRIKYAIWYSFPLKFILAKLNKGKRSLGWSYLASSSTTLGQGMPIRFCQRGQLRHMYYPIQLFSLITSNHSVTESPI